MKYLLDTNVVSYIVKRNSALLVQKLKAIPSHQIAVSVITEAEVLFGLQARPNATRLARDVTAVLSMFQILSWTSSTAQYYATLRKSLKESGIGIGNDLDVLIASHALEHELILVTHDARIQKLQSLTISNGAALQIEDWVE